MNTRSSDGHDMGEDYYVCSRSARDRESISQHRIFLLILPIVTVLIALVLNRLIG